jgi:hypothetical protein
MLKQNAFAAAAAANDGERFAMRDFEINAPQNFLVADFLFQPAHGNHQPVMSILRRHY